MFAGSVTGRCRYRAIPDPKSLLPRQPRPRWRVTTSKLSSAAALLPLQVRLADPGFALDAVHRRLAEAMLGVALAQLGIALAQLGIAFPGDLRILNGLGQISRLQRPAVLFSRQF